MFLHDLSRLIRIYFMDFDDVFHIHKSCVYQTSAVDDIPFT